MPKYRTDSDLEILQHADNEMLAVLVDYLTHNRDGGRWLTEQLTGNEAFIKSNGNYQDVWQLIAAELQYFGGDTLANAVRGQGVLYRDILNDVCHKVGMKIEDSMITTEELEKALIIKVFKNSWKSMTSDEKASVKTELNIDLDKSDDISLEVITDGISHGYFSYQVSMLIASSFANAILGTNIAILAGAAGAIGASRLIGALAGPLGIIVTTLLTLPMLSGPAYRVTLPAVIQVAAIRQQLTHSQSS